MTESPDPLDNEVSVSVDIKETGVTAKSKSRLVSGLDRLLGNLSDWANVRLEGDIRSRRAAASANEKLTGALTDYAIEQLHADPAFAQRALAHHLESTLRSQNNRERVVSEALEDLRREPPSAEQATSGPDTISPEILDRLENYASGASTQEVQERWGRVLASEVRRPGTFSLKVLRIIDELDYKVAETFEKFASFRVDEHVPKVLIEKLQYVDELLLLDAGLIVDPGLGQTSPYRDVEIDGAKYWLWKADPYLICIPKDDFHPVLEIGSEKAVTTNDKAPAVPVYLLTPAGQAICHILPPVDNSLPYYNKVVEQYPSASRWKISDDREDISKVNG